MRFPKKIASSHCLTAERSLFFILPQIFSREHSAQRLDCVAGVVRLELEYPCASHVFEMS
jgi:hypothetical protein